MLLIAPVLAVGSFYSLKQRSGQIKPRRAQVWFERYARLRPHLEGVPRVKIVYDPTGPRNGNKRLFQAHYVVAPTVVRRWGSEPPPVRPRKVPLLFDFYSHDLLEKALRRMARQARKRGIVLETVRLGRGLALVRMKEE